MKILQDSLSYLPKNKTYIFYLEYEFTTQKEIFLFKEWLKNKNKLWEYEINGSYIAKIKY